MTTAEAIESITDPGRFERLARPVLRYLFLDCKAVIGLGINAEGKTVRNPVDGFCRVPGSKPNRYVMIQFATHGRDALKRKWLFDHQATAKSSKRGVADDGDLIKAAQIAATIRHTDPEAQFAVYLCTNRVPPQPLIQEVYSWANSHSVEAVPVDQSQLTDYLDAMPEGQWLRQEHLGIEAEQVSRSLIAALSSKSLNQYATERTILGEGSTVRTRSLTVAEGELKPTVSACILVGPSGVGKSVIGYQILQSHVSNSGLGLWIPEHVVDRASSLAEAVEITIGTLRNRIQPGSGHSVLALATKSAPLLLVVDDVCRTNQPVVLLEKLLGWARSASPRALEGSAGPGSSVKIVCPIWNAHWAKLEPAYRDERWLAVARIERMVRQESVSCLRNGLKELRMPLTDSSLDDLAAHLKDDPILLHLFCRLLLETPEANPRKIAGNVLRGFVERAIGRLPSHDASLAAYNFALIQAAEQMIRHRNLHPTLEQLDRWLNNKGRAVELLHRLAAQDDICRFEVRKAGLYLEFRHDRILEYHLSEAIGLICADQTADLEFLEDPFFTPYIGRAIGLHRTSVATLERIAANSPVALIVALDYLDADSDYSRTIREILNAWLLKWPSHPSSVLEDATGALIESDSPLILSATAGVVDNKGVLWARFKSGDAAAGAKVLPHPYWLEMRFRWVESAIAQALRRHRAALTNEVRVMLASPDLDLNLRKGALVLAGYLGDESLSGAVIAAWHAGSHESDLLLPALWAALRCDRDRPERPLDLILPVVLTLSHDSGKLAPSDRSEVLELLGGAVRNGLSDSTVEKLVTIAIGGGELGSAVGFLLHGIDHPRAIDYVLERSTLTSYRALVPGKGPVPGRYVTLHSTEGLGWSEPTLREMQCLWQDDTKPDSLRIRAFKKWVGTCKDPTEASLFPEVISSSADCLRLRAVRGDHRVADEIANRVESDPLWLQYVAKVWSPNLALVVERLLAALVSELANGAEGYSLFLAQVLRDIPPDDGDRLLKKFWLGLRRSADFVKVALYFGTTEWRNLAAAAIRDTGSAKHPLFHVHSFFGFQYDGMVDRLTMKHLETLLPYLQVVDDLTIFKVTQFCFERGYGDWARTNLEPECLRRMTEPASNLIRACMSQQFPKDEELLRELDDIATASAREMEVRIKHWLRGFEIRADRAERPLSLLRCWLDSLPSETRYRVVAISLRNAGTRSALEILAPYAASFDNVAGCSLFDDAKYAITRRSLL